MKRRDHLTNGRDLSLDTCLDLLANRQRRRIIEFFVENETDHASIDELIAEVVQDGIGVTGERPEHDAVASTLFHVHLPKFAEADLLEYDPRNLQVRYRGDPKVEEVFETIRHFE